MSFFRGSTELPPPDRPSLDENETAVMDKLAAKVVEWNMTTPAIIFLESMRPLNFIGSQVMVFFEPMIQSFFSFKDYDTMRTALEKRESIEILLQSIERQDAVAEAKRKRFKKWLKQEKKSWKWYQRWPGVFRPKLQVPDEVLNPPKAEAKDDTPPEEPKT